MKLSILIPAYNYTEGIERILNRAKELKYVNKKKYEIIIHDNSENFRIYNIYKKYADYLNIHYKKNLKFIGAANNWNSLLKVAKGQFIYMIHHDEFPQKKNFFSKLILTVENYKNYDIFFFNCLLVNNNIILRQNFFFLLKKLIITYFPAYILRRNVVGSISNIVFKNKNILFDKRLVWLVDVDFYYRLIKKSKKNFLFLNQENILSFYKYRNSITNKLTNEKLKKEREHKILSNNKSYQFLKIYEIFLVSIIEKFIWFFIIFNLRFFYFLKKILYIKN